MGARRRVDKLDFILVSPRKALRQYDYYNTMWRKLYGGQAFRRAIFGWCLIPVSNTLANRLSRT